MEGGILLIRVANFDDLEAVASLFNKYRVFYGKPTDLELALRFVDSSICGGRSVIFVAETEDGVIVAFAQLFATYSSLAARNAWILNDLYVEEAARKKGVATALLNRVIRFGAESQASWITLQTSKANVAAHALYRKMGFSFDEEFLTFNKVYS